MYTIAQEKLGPEWGRPVIALFWDMGWEQRRIVDHVARTVRQMGEGLNGKASGR